MIRLGGRGAAAAVVLAVWWTVTLAAPDWPATWAAAGVAVAVLACLVWYGGEARTLCLAVPAAGCVLVTAWWVAVQHLVDDPPRVWLDRPALFAAAAVAVGVVCHAAWRPTGKPDRVRKAAPLRAALAATGVRGLELPEPGERDPVRLARERQVGLGKATVVTLPDGVTGRDLTGRAERIAGALQRHETDVLIEAGTHAGQVVVWVGGKDAGKAQAGTWPGIDGYPQGRSALDPIDIGLDRYGEPVTVQLHGGSGMLIGSLPGQGKSSLMNLVLASVLGDARAQAFIIDCKGGGDFTAWRDAASRFYAGAPERDPEAILEILRAARNVMEARYSQLPEHRASKITEKLSSEPGMGPLLVVVDEAQELFARKSTVAGPVQDEALNLATTIIARGRAVNVWILFAGQRVTDDEIPAAITQRVTTRVAFRLSTQPASQAVLGPDAWADGYRATKLPAPGVGFVAVDAEVRHLRAWHVPDEAAYECAAKAAQMRRDRLHYTGEPTPVLTADDHETLRLIEAGKPPRDWPVQGAARDVLQDTRNRLEMAEHMRLIRELEDAELAARVVDTVDDEPDYLGDDEVGAAALADTIGRVWPTGQRGPYASAWLSVLARSAGVELERLADLLERHGAPVEPVRMRPRGEAQRFESGMRREAFEDWRSVL